MAADHEAFRKAQTTIQNSFKTGDTVVVDLAIARFFLGCDVPANKANHFLFKEMVRSIMSAKLKYKPVSQSVLQLFL